jgi:hypothetical protein
MDKLIINQLPAAQLRGQRVFIRIDGGEQLTEARDFVDMNSLHAAQPTLEYLISFGGTPHCRNTLGEAQWKDC